MILINQTAKGNCHVIFIRKSKKETRYHIYKAAIEFQRNGDYQLVERTYRDALLIYPNKPGMVLGLAGVLALQDKSQEAIELMERGLPLSSNEKQKSTVRAVLCFLYLKCGRTEEANALASALPHIRESREVIQPLIASGMDENEISKNMKSILLGEDEELW